MYLQSPSFCGSHCVIGSFSNISHECWVGLPTSPTHQLKLQAVWRLWPVFWWVPTQRHWWVLQCPLLEWQELLPPARGLPYLSIVNLNPVCRVFYWAWCCTAFGPGHIHSCGSGQWGSAGLRLGSSSSGGMPLVAIPPQWHWGAKEWESRQMQSITPLIGGIFWLFQEAGHISRQMWLLPRSSVRSKHTCLHVSECVGDSPWDV